MKDRTIVFVDDNKTDLVLYGAMLHNMQYNVELIQDVDIAVCTILTLSPNIVFLDVNLTQNTSGIDIASELRKRGYKGNICMISGDSEPQTIKRSIDVGADDYLLKPVYSYRLNKIIEEAV